MLRGNLAPDGCVVKTAGVPPEIWKFRGPALVVDSQEQAIEVILNDTLKPGMALVIRYEGPKGGPGMQEMLYPTSFVKGKGIGKQVAMLTDGRYSGGSSGLAIGHMRLRLPTRARWRSSRTATSSISISKPVP